MLLINCYCLLSFINDHLMKRRILNVLALIFEREPMSVIKTFFKDVIISPLGRFAGQ